MNWELKFTGALSEDKLDLRSVAILVHPIDSLYTVESVKDTVQLIEHIFGAKNARTW